MIGKVNEFVGKKRILEDGFIFVKVRNFDKGEK